MVEISYQIWLIGGGVAGLIFGSFLSAIITRWPKGISVIKGRSHCDKCNVTLKWQELVPVISYLLQRGRCRKCNAPIGPAVIQIELGCALIGIAAVAVSPNIAGVAGAIFGWLLLALAIFDLRHFWLPDRLTLFLAASGLVWGLFVEWPEMTDRLIGGVTGFVALSLVAVIYRYFRGREGMGGGDPKLFGAIGCWLGWQYLPFVLLGASVAGLLSIISLYLRGQGVSATLRLPLGTYMAIAAFPIWIWMAGSLAL